MQDDSSRSRNDIDADDADIRPIYDEEPMAEVDQYAKQCQVKSPMLDSSLDTKTTEFLIQSLESENIFLKRTLLKCFKNDFSKDEALNSSKNMPRFSSNGMIYNHYLEEAKKTTHEKDKNSKSSMMPSTSLQSTTHSSKAKPRSNNHTSRSLPVSKSSCVTSNVLPLVDHSKNSSPFSDSKHFVYSTCHKCVFNVNHDACITKLLKEVNSRKVKSHKTRNSNKPIEQKSHTQQPGGNLTGIEFSILLVLGGFLRERYSLVAQARLTTHGSKVDISKIRECKQTLDLSEGTSLTGQQKQIIDFCAPLHLMASKKITTRPRTTTSTKVPTADMIVMTSMIKLESIFGPLFDEYFNGENQVVSKSSVVTTADASDKRQQQPDSTSSTSTLATTVTANGNFDMNENKGIMPTKIELTLEQSQQGVSDDVLVSIEGVEE
ncbi:hypothetical protein Tco_1093995 [Tanacetum coccineum]|uniref:Uncharacterized protein n=1 Tax=Tanacetum coccineum TaxID=301880 RepID=A0ABQ5IEA4_9ASTR